MSLRVPARELLVHPAALAALASLVFNDHWMKIHRPGLVSGKLSDAAGLVVFPLLLAVAHDSLARLVGRPSPRSSTSVLGSALLVALVFGLVKTFPPATDAYRHALGFVQWPLHAAWRILRGSPVARARARGDGSHRYAGAPVRRRRRVDRARSTRRVASG